MAETVVLPLAYDDLPPGSDIKRVIDCDRVRITVPPGEPPREVLRQTAIDALASGATSSWALLLLCFIGFYVGICVNRISGVALIWAWAFFAIFCTALVGLVVWVRYGLMIDAIRAGRRQATIVAASPTRLLIETVGPFGDAEHDLAPAAIARIHSGRGRLRDAHGRVHHLHRLAIDLRDGRLILLLPGRDDRELHAVAGLLTRTIGLSPTGSCGDAPARP